MTLLERQNFMPSELAGLVQEKSYNSFQADASSNGLVNIEYIWLYFHWKRRGSGGALSMSWWLAGPCGVRIVSQHDLEAINNTGRAVWYSCLNNSFQCLNNNNIFDTYFYNTQTCISTTLKTEQQYLNIATKRAKRSKHCTCSVLL